MGYFIVILIVCLLIVGITGGLKIFRWDEACIIGLITLFLSAGAAGVGTFAQTADTEIWNGAVVSKDKERVSCRHSYSCHCRESCSGSGKSRSCSTTCDTCYDHTNDFDWNVRTTIGDFEIERIDRQGANTPPRWAAVVIDDPVSKTHTYTNYVKGARDNVLNRGDTKISYPMPAYPDGVYDYYKLNHVVDGVGLKDLAEWNKQVALALRKLGPSKQVNLVVVFTKLPEIFAEQLNAAWLGGKKNDVIVVVGVQEAKMDWVKVLSWTKREDFKVALRDDLVGLPLDPVATVGLIANQIATKFDRRHMSEFEYLQYDIEPPEWSLYLALFFLFFPAITYYIILRNQ